MVYRSTHRVKAGLTDLKLTTGGQETAIEEVRIHPQWRTEGRGVLYFDIAIIFLKSPLLLDYTLQPICLPEQPHAGLQESMVGDALTVTGWGRDDDDYFGNNLTSIDVTILLNEECTDAYKNTQNKRDNLSVRFQLPRFIAPSMFCADNNINHDVGTCHGDSGGTAFVR